MNTPLKTVHIVGTQKTNYPWGFENRLFPVFQKMGWDIISTDFRQEHSLLPTALNKPADFVLFNKAESVPAELIRSIKYPTILWWAELLGSIDQTDQQADQKRNQLLNNVGAYDFVFLHDEASVPLVKSWGVKNVSVLPTAVVEPNVHKKLNIPKKYEVTFVGQLTQRREQFLSQLLKKVKVHIAKCWGPEELNMLFNQSEIVINIHLSTLKNTETRVGEVLGAGSFLLSEELSSPKLFLDGKHLVCTKPNNVDDMASKIEYYLEHKKEREVIAAKGHRYIHKNHTLAHRINEIIGTNVSKQHFRYWPSHLLGVIRDSYGNETENLLEFYKAVRKANA
jgi:spore maturation protein CgeB